MREAQVETGQSATRLEPKGWVATLIVAAAGAVPTLWWIETGAGQVLDDWNLTALARFEGLSAFTVNMTHRPLGKLYDSLAYGTFDKTVWPYLVLLAAFNALVAVLLWKIALDHLSARYAAAFVGIWVTLPNRSASHYWADAGPNVLALALVLIAVKVGFAPTRRREARWLVPTLTILSVLLYHGVIAVAGAVCLVYAWRETAVRPPRSRWLALGATAVTFGALALLSVESSGRRDTISPFSTTNRLVSVHLGAGVLPTAIGVIGLACVLMLAWSAAAFVLPGFTARIEERMALLGAGIILAGTLPFLLAGFPLTALGINDRGNLYADVGTALLFTATVGFAWRSRYSALGALAAALLIAVFGVQLSQGADAYRQAVDDGEALRAAIRASDLDLTQPLVLEPLPNHGGVGFIYADAELRGVLALTDPDSHGLDAYAEAFMVERGRRDTPAPAGAAVLRLEDGQLVVAGR